MKHLRLLLVLLVISCSAPRVVYDFDKKASFDAYKTYNYYPQIETGLNDLDNKRLFAQVDSILQSKGFRKVTTPELHVNIVTNVFRGPNRSSVGIGIGGSGRNVGVGVSGGIPIGGPKVNQQIIFDLIDIKKNELIWQATSTTVLKENVTPEKKEAYFRAIVQKVFKGFPPKKQK